LIKYSFFRKLAGSFCLSILFALHVHASDWYSSEEMVTLYEAITKTSSESLYLDSDRDLPKEMLKTYIYKIDPYGDYFTKDEYKAFQNAQSSDYAGVGMLLYQQDRNAKILCIPVTEEVKKKGVFKYDELLSVDGHSVKGKNFYLVSSWIRGRKNSSVTFKIKSVSGQIRTITMDRKAQSFKTTQRVMKNGTAMIRIIRFMHETPQELQTILRKWPKNIPIVIDLRGNGGGDLFAAVNSADLMLPKDTLLCSVETRKEHIDYRAATMDITKGAPVFLLQDKFSASAAEVFIAALTQNGRVQSIGERSFGKGVAQKFIPLGDGGALLLTYGKIITPNGESYHKKGLLPTSALSLDALLKAYSNFAQ